MKPMPRLPSDTALLVIDVQEAIDDPRWGPRNNAGAEDRIAALIAAWRQARMPILHVRHDSAEPRSPYRRGAPGHAFKAAAMPLAGEAIVAKRGTSAFIGTRLDRALTEAGVTTLVVCGVLTHNSVAATVGHAGNLGYRVIVAADACWAVDVAGSDGRRWPAEDVHQMALAVMGAEHAVVSDTLALAEAALILRLAAGRPWRRQRRTRP
jgi:nicotinamidase-related amidase